MATLIALAVLTTWYGFDRRNRRRALSQRFHRTTEQLDVLTEPLTDVVDTLRRHVELVRGAYCDDEIAKVLGSCEERLRTGDELLVKRSELAISRDQVMARRDLDSVSQTIHVWQDLEETVTEILPGLEAEEERLAKAISYASELPSQLETVSALVDEVREAAWSAEVDGFAVATDIAFLDAVPERVARIKRLIAARQILATEGPLTELMSDLTAARDNLGTLRQRRHELFTRLAQLAEAQRELDDRNNDAEAAYATLVEHHAPPLWDGFDAHLTQAQEHTARAAQEMAAVEDALSAGDPGRGEHAARAAESAQSAARRELSCPVDRLGAVRELQHRLPRRKKELYEQAVELEKRADSDKSTQTFKSVAKEFRAQLDRLDMTADRPDWLEYDRRIGEIYTLLHSTEIGLRHCQTSISQLRSETKSLSRRLREERSARYEVESARRWRPDRAF